MKSAKTTNKQDLNKKDPMSLTASQIVSELNRYIVRQEKAKKAVAIALRNRGRRKRVEGSLRNEIVPKNMLMIGYHYYGYHYYEEA